MTDGGHQLRLEEKRARMSSLNTQVNGQRSSPTLTSRIESGETGQHWTHGCLIHVKIQKSWREQLWCSLVTSTRFFWTLYDVDPCASIHTSCNSRCHSEAILHTLYTKVLMQLGGTFHATVQWQRPNTHLITLHRCVHECFSISFQHHA